MYSPSIKEFPPMTMVEIDRLHNDLPHQPSLSGKQIERGELSGFLSQYYPSFVASQIAADVNQFWLSQPAVSLPLTGVRFNRPIEIVGRPNHRFPFSLYPIILEYASPSGLGVYVNQGNEAHPYARLLTYIRECLKRDEIVWTKRYAVETDPEHLTGKEHTKLIFFQYTVPPEITSAKELVLYSGRFDQRQLFPFSSGPNALSILLPPEARDAIWHHAIDSLLLLPPTLSPNDQLMSSETVQIQTCATGHDVVFLRLSLFNGNDVLAEHPVEDHLVLDYAFKLDLRNQEHGKKDNTVSVYAYPPARYLVVKGAALAFPPQSIISTPRGIDLPVATRFAIPRLGIVETELSWQSRRATHARPTSTSEPVGPDLDLVLVSHLVRFEFTVPDQFLGYLSRLRSDPRTTFQIPENVITDIYRLISNPHDNVKYVFTVTRPDIYIQGRVRLVCMKDDGSNTLFEYIGNNVRYTEQG